MQNVLINVLLAQAVAVLLSDSPVDASCLLVAEYTVAGDHVRRRERPRLDVLSFLGCCDFAQRFISRLSTRRATRLCSARWSMAGSHALRPMGEVCRRRLQVPTTPSPTINRSPPPQAAAQPGNFTTADVRNAPDRRVGRTASILHPNMSGKGRRGHRVI